MNDEEPSKEQRIGENIDRLRRGAGLTQKEVADYMRSAGFKWSQRTVWQVEHGERPIRLSEAYELAKQLNINVEGLLLAKESAIKADRLIQAVADYRDAERKLGDAMVGVHEAIERASDAVSEVSRETLLELKDELPEQDVGRVALAHEFLTGYSEGGINHALKSALEWAGLDVEIDNGQP